MLRHIIQFSLKFKGVVLTLAILLLVYGLYISANAKLDVFPNFVQPQVVIQTECPGLSPEQVELLVTMPIETMVNGLGDMESLRSESIEGLSIITAVFIENTDVFRARQMLAEKLNETAGQLPVNVKMPRMTPLTSSTMDLLKIGLVTDKLSPMQLRDFADWTLKPRLLSVPGVAKCSVFGGEVRQLQIQVLPERLLAHQLSLTDVLTAARLSTGLMGAGFIETSNQRITIQTEGQTPTPAALGNVVVSHARGLSVRLKDVARVVEGPEPKFGDTVVMGRWGVLMTMSSQYGANTMEVTHALEEALQEMQPVFDKEGIKLYPRLHRPATFIESALANMKHSLALGAVLVTVVLFLLLGSVRTACISLLAIPLSLLTAVILLQKLGISINTITLGGLAIALGEVVDDSIIDVENIYRRLRENKVLPQPRPVFQVVFEASLEVRQAVVYATFIVVLVFIPVFTLSGLQGSFFSPLALSYIFAILASLLVALTVTPALALALFGQGVRRAEDPRLQRWLKTGYEHLLRTVARWPRAVIAVVTVVCLGALVELPMAKGGFLPDFREGHFVLQVFTVPGTSLPMMLQLGTSISQELLRNTNIITVEQQVGRAELGEDPWGPHRSEFHVELATHLSAGVQEETKEFIEETLKGFAGIQYEVLTFLGDRIGETLTGETSPVVVNIFGEDLDLLDAKAKEVANLLNTIPGHSSVEVKSPPGAPRLVIRLNPEKMMQFGFRPVEVLEAIRASYQGVVVAQTHQGNRVADVTVVLDEKSRTDPEAIGQLLLHNSEGGAWPLNQLAEIYSTSGRFSILHEGARRRQTVTCATTGRDISSFVTDAKRRITSQISFPAGVYAVFSGAAQAREKAARELLLHSLMAAVGILLLLSIVFGSWQNLLLVLVNIPFAMVGGVAAVWVSDRLGMAGEQGLTIGSLVGFVTLFGITTRNSIMMVSHFEHLVIREGLAWDMTTALRGATERLMPILITATVTALGLLPLAVGTGEAGREIEGPMAIVILGGLLTSTVLNLLVLPTLALRYGHFKGEIAIQDPS